MIPREKNINRKNKISKNFLTYYKVKKISDTSSQKLKIMGVNTLHFLTNPPPVLQGSKKGGKCILGD